MRGRIGRLFASPRMTRLGLLLLCAAYLQGGIDKLVDFPGAVAEQAQFGLAPAKLFAVAVIDTELIGSALVLSGSLRWLGALWLGGFTVIASFLANRFWDLPPGMERFMAANAFFEHLGLVGGSLNALAAREVVALVVLLWVKLVLLIAGFGLAPHFGPFPDGNTWQALATGVTLVAATAVQNGIQRIHLPTAPPSTLMTGNTTQVVIDAVDLTRGRLAPDVHAITRARLVRMGTSIASFAVGCAAAALMYAVTSMWCFALPPLIALGAALAHVESRPVAIVNK